MFTLQSSLLLHLSVQMFNIILDHFDQTKPTNNFTKAKTTEQCHFLPSCFYFFSLNVAELETLLTGRRTSTSSVVTRGLKVVASHTPVVKW